MTAGWFVTGTDTGVGKTVLSRTLVRALVRSGLRVAVMKPVASGADEGPDGLRNGDALALMAASNVAAEYSLVNPYCFKQPVAPEFGAELADEVIDLSVIQSGCARLLAQSDRLVVEGVGGWYAPLNAAETVADMAQRLDLPVVLVVGLRLGCLSHALMSVDLIQRRGLRLAAWVGSCLDSNFEFLEKNIQCLRQRIPAPCLGVLPHVSDVETDIDTLMQALNLDALV